MTLSLSVHTSLSVDAMYYHAARSNYELAVQCMTQINNAETHYRGLLEQETEIKEKYGDDLDRAGNELERVAINLENQEYEIGLAYAPFLRQLSTVHILCAASLEAHINIRSKELLVSRLIDDFERISLEAKWLFLPKMYGALGFDPGTEPFQSFSRLVKYRNALTHYKGLREEWNSLGGVPKFLRKLGLTLEDAQSSIDAVRGMITTFSSQVGQEIPYWLNTQEGKYFEVDIQLIRH